MDGSQRKKLSFSAVLPTVEYFVLSVLWIVVTDRLLATFVKDPTTNLALQTVKGWAFVTVTTIFIFVILKRLKTNVDELQTSEEKYRYLFDTMSQGVAIQDEKGKIVEVNDAACKIFDASREQLLGQDSWKLKKENGVDMNTDEAPSAVALRTGKPVCDMTIGVFVPKMNGYKWMLISSIPRFRDGEKKPYSTLTTFVDITDRIKMEKQIEEVEHLIRESQEVAQIGSYITDFVAGDWKSSEILDQIFGIDKNYVRSVAGWLDIVHPDDREMMNNYLQGILNSHSFFDKEYRILKKSDNQTRWVHGLGKISFDKNGKALTMVGTIQDITDRKIAQEKILTDERKLEAILRDMGDAVFVTDENKNLIIANKAMEELFGLTEKEMVGKNIEEALALSYETQGRKPIETIETVFKNKQSVRLGETLIIKNKNGKTISVDGVVSPIIDENEKLVGTVWLLRDVTKERELKQMRSDFISLASHQLRTPLTGIKWFVELLDENAPKMPINKVQEYVRKIGESNNRMIDLVNDLMITSKADSGKLVKEVSNYSIKELLQQAIDQQGRIFLDKNIKIEGINSIPEDLEVDADFVQMTQVFGNLFNNAASYSPVGSIIEVGLSQDSGMIKIFIRDHGVGIPVAQQNKIFEKFFRADNVAKTVPGSGLGLYVAKSMIESHGGKIRFESKENLGTTFFVELPIKQKEDGKKEESDDRGG